MFEDETAPKDNRPFALLLDGDVFAYQGAATSEYVMNLGSTYHLMADMDEAQRHVRNNIESVRKEIRGKVVVNTLSCPSRKYWRHDVLPEYKGARQKQYGVSGPICLGDLKDWMATEYETYRWENMEADDVMGILATDPNFLPDYRKVIVSIDKDMRTIPDVWIFNPDKDYQPWYNTKEEADKWFLAQAIGGDTTDGYSGCRGMSTESASAFLDAQWFWDTYEHTFKSGARKGTTEVRWRKEDPRSTWENIVSLFVKAGQSEEEALINARVARILTNDMYDRETGEVKLWLPSQEL